MADDWDLQAVVRSCSAAITTSSFTTTSGFLQHDDDQFLLFSDLFEQRNNDGVEELQDLLKPFFPQFRNLTYQNRPISLLSGLGGFQDPLPLQQENQQEKEKQCVVGSSLNIGTTSTTLISHTPSPRSNKRKKQMKRVCEVPTEDLSSDIWSWRKYGQKPIKGSPYPRGYYRCSSSKGCLARKQVERNRYDPGMFIVTYTAEHNHPIPTHRNSLYGIIGQKPVTPETVTAGEKLEDLMEEGEVELGVSDMVIKDDFFEGLDEITGLVTGDSSPGHFPVPWRSNNATTTTAGGG